MSYIRTKEGIYEVEKLNLNKIVGNIKYEIIDNKLFKTMYGYEAHLYKYEIIKQSDNLDELCDIFVFIDDVSFNFNDSFHYLINDRVLLKNMNSVQKHISKLAKARGNIIKYKQIVYGAIWTDKGLIYVAKMDEDGVLCLI